MGLMMGSLRSRDLNCCSCLTRYSTFCPARLGYIPSVLTPSSPWQDAHKGSMDDAWADSCDCPCEPCKPTGLSAAKATLEPKRPTRAIPIKSFFMTFLCLEFLGFRLTNGEPTGTGTRENARWAFHLVFSYQLQTAAVVNLQAIPPVTRTDVEVIARAVVVGEEGMTTHVQSLHHGQGVFIDQLNPGSALVLVDNVHRHIRGIRMGGGGFGGSGNRNLLHHREVFDIPGSNHGA